MQRTENPMEDLKRLLSPGSKEWSLALLVIIATILAANALKSILTRLYERRGWKILKTLAPSIANILYIFGFRIFFELAPLQGAPEKWIEGGIYVFAVFVLVRLCEKAALMGIEWSLRQTENAEALQKGFLPLISNLITVFVFGSGGIMILNHFHYDAMSLITALGVSSLAVGLAAKDTLSNMISGFILMLDRNLRPGDDIQISDLTGKVQMIGLRSTQLLLGNGNTLIVPNADLVNTKIINLSIHSREQSCTVQIRVPISVPFPQVKAITLEILDQIEWVSKTKSKSVQLLNLTEGYQQIQMSFWVNRLDAIGPATSQFNERLLERAQKCELELFTHPQLKLQ